ACDTSPGLTLTTRSWFPTAMLLAVAVAARALAALPRGEATLSRELRTPPLPAGHVPGGCCWEGRRDCRSVLRPQDSYISDLVSHPNAKAQRPGGSTRGLDSPRLPCKQGRTCPVRCSVLVRRDHLTGSS